MRQLLAFAEFVRKQYQGIIIGAVLLGLALGLWTSAPGKALQTYSQALTFLMILFISLTITPRQFVLVTRQPLAVLSGVLLNFVFMPLLCWGLARLFVSDSQLAVGVILVGVVPCAGAGSRLVSKTSALVLVIRRTAGQKSSCTAGARSSAWSHITPGLRWGRARIR